MRFSFIEILGLGLISLEGACFMEELIILRHVLCGLCEYREESSSRGRAMCLGNWQCGWGSGGPT
jgi:hypothetical protein